MFRDSCEAKNVSHASPAARSYSKRSRYSSEKDQSISSKEEPKRKRTKLETSQKWSPEPKSARFVLQTFTNFAILTQVSFFKLLISNCFK